jgi:hypothetical protein
MLKISNDCADNLAKNQQSTVKASDEFIGVKVNEKIFKTLDAIGLKMVSKLDGYTATIVSAALHNDGICFAKTALVVLCRDIEYNGEEQSQVIKHRMRVAVSTADTQKSSTRMMLRALNLAVIDKRKKDDIITLTESGKKIFSALFGNIADDSEEVETSEELQTA